MEHRGGEFAKAPRRDLGLGEKCEGHEGVGGQKIKRDRAVAGMIDDPVEGMTPRGRECNGERAMAAGLSDVFAHTGA